MEDIEECGIDVQSVNSRSLRRRVQFSEDPPITFGGGFSSLRQRQSKPVWLLSIEEFFFGSSFLTGTSRWTRWTGTFTRGLSYALLLLVAIYAIYWAFFFRAGEYGADQMLYVLGDTDYIGLLETKPHAPPSTVHCQFVTEAYYEAARTADKKVFISYLEHWGDLLRAFADKHNVHVVNSTLFADRWLPEEHQRYLDGPLPVPCMCFLALSNQNHTFLRLTKKGSIGARIDVEYNDVYRQHQNTKRSIEVPSEYAYVSLQDTLHEHTLTLTHAPDVLLADLCSN